MGTVGELPLNRHEKYDEYDEYDEYNENGEKGLVAKGQGWYTFNDVTQI